MAITTWSTVVLCQDKDLRRFESNVMEWVKSDGHASRYRLTAKERITTRLRSQLRNQDLLKSTDITDVLDLVANPDVLKDAACFMTLHLIATDKMVHADDTWSLKAVKYKDDFDEEFPVAVSLISFDTDESGAIADAEKYNLTLGVRITRGG